MKPLAVWQGASYFIKNAKYKSAERGEKLGQNF
jgi:hypothetical protein